MRKGLSGMLLPAAAAMTVTLGTAAAFASSTWSISPAGSFTAPLNTGTEIRFAGINDANTVTCTVSTANGAVPKSGHQLSGKGIATVSGVKWGTEAATCTDLIGLGYTAVSTNGPWSFNAVTYNSTVDGGQTTGTITASGTGVGVTLNSEDLTPPCKATFGGTAAAPASLNVLYDNSSHLLAITGAKNLKVLSSNCPATTAGTSWTLFSLPTSEPGSNVSHGYDVSSKIHLTSP